jgi:hypothetical protein
VGEPPCSHGVPFLSRGFVPTPFQAFLDNVGGTDATTLLFFAGELRLGKKATIERLPGLALPAFPFECSGSQDPPWEIVVLGSDRILRYRYYCLARLQGCCTFYAKS